MLYADERSAYRITVQCENIMDNTLIPLREGFDEKKHICVHFIGEPAVDQEGPRREYLMNAVANCGSLLQGPPNRRVLRHNTSAFQVITLLHMNIVKFFFV